MIQLASRLKYIARGLLFSFSICAPNGALAEGPFHFECSTDPNQWIIGPNARIDLNVSSHWSLGAGFFSQDRQVRTVQIKEFSQGLNLTYLFGGGKTHSWIVDGGLLYGVLTASLTESSGNVDQIKLGNWTSRLVAGHQWYFGHFGLGLAAGVENNSAGHAKIYNTAGAEVATVAIAPSRLVIEGSLGLAF